MGHKRGTAWLMEAFPVTIKIRISAEDKAAWEALAKRERMSLSAWCRVGLKRVEREENKKAK